eukprot:1650555-Amphidinium_carterae.1
MRQRVSYRNPEAPAKAKNHNVKWAPGRVYWESVNKSSDACLALTLGSDSQIVKESFTTVAVQS